MHKHLSIYLETNEILYKNQYGFFFKSSTIDAIIKFVTDTATYLDEKESVMAVFLVQGF